VSRLENGKTESKKRKKLQFMEIGAYLMRRRNTIEIKTNNKKEGDRKITHMNSKIKEKSRFKVEMLIESKKSKGQAVTPPKDRTLSDRK